MNRVMICHHDKRALNEKMIVKRAISSKTIQYIMTPNFINAMLARSRPLLLSFSAPPPKRPLCAGKNKNTIENTKPKLTNPSLSNNPTLSKFLISIIKLVFITT